MQAVINFLQANPDRVLYLVFAAISLLWPQSALGKLSRTFALDLSKKDPPVRPSPDEVKP